MERIAVFAAAHHGAFPLSEAAALGITRHQLHLACSTGEIVHVHERVYRFAGAPVTWKTSLMAACWAGGIRAVASYRSAAALKALPAGSEICTEITCPRWRRARHDGLIVHETRALHPIDVTVVDGIPTTTVARTLLDLAAIISPPDLERSLENALRRHLVSLDELDAMLHRLSRPGRTGLRSLRQLVQARMVPGFRPTESEAESLILQSIRRHGIVEPVREFKVYNGSVRIGRVDLSYPDPGSRLNTTPMSSTPVASQRLRTRPDGIGWSAPAGFRSSHPSPTSAMVGPSSAQLCPLPSETARSTHTPASPTLRRAALVTPDGGWSREAALWRH